VEYNPFWDAPKRVNLAAAAGRIAFLRRERRLLLDDSHNGIRCVAVLGQRNEAIDAVEEYCRYLGAALEKHAFSFEIARVEWATKGWRRALRELRQKVGNERNTWVLLQYTALAWSRHGFSLRVPGIIRSLKKNGARCAVVFHDVEGYLAIGSSTASAAPPSSIPCEKLCGWRTSAFSRSPQKKFHGLAEIRAA